MFKKCCGMIVSSENAKKVFSRFLYIRQRGRAGG